MSKKWPKNRPKKWPKNRSKNRPKKWPKNRPKTPQKRVLQGAAIARKTFARHFKPMNNFYKIGQFVKIDKKYTPQKTSKKLTLEPQKSPKKSIFTAFYKHHFFVPRPRLGTGNPFSHARFGHAKFGYFWPQKTTQKTTLFSTLFSINLA